MGQPFNVFSDYSFLRSALTIDRYAELGSQLGYTSLVLADLDSTMGLVEFYQKCLAKQIKPIMGVSHYLNLAHINVKAPYDILLSAIALDNTGYQKMLSLATYSTDKEWGLILQESRKLTDHLAFILHLDDDFTIEVLSTLKQIVSDFSWEIYIAIDPREFSEEKLNIITDWLSHNPDIMAIASEKVRYPSAHYQKGYRVLRAIDREDDLSQSDLSTGSYYLPSQKEFNQFFPTTNPILNDSLNENESLARKVEVSLLFKKLHLPKFKTPDNEDSSQYLKKLCYEGLEKKALTEDEAYRDRLDHELTVIDRMGFSDYFLIVADVIDYAKSMKIVTSPGRGSAAGSLTSYLLGITELDPIKENLLFERFLNEERFNMPDIDLDLPDNKRDEVLQYVAKKYGENHVAQIATVGTFAAKSAIRDVGRVLKSSASVVDRLAKSVPNKLKIKLADAYRESRQFAQLVDQSAESQKIVEIAQQIEGLSRHLSTHAAGVVICDQPLTNFTALFLRNKQLPLTQFQMGSVEEIGLLKMDFLGIRNLAIVQDAVTFIKVDDPDFDLTAIPLNDKSVYQLFSQGDTDGIFQFESAGIRQVLKRLMPQSLEDLTAVNALYRPGPMEQIDHFIKRKHHEELIHFPHDTLKKILANTYGIMVYQEQVMQVAVTMAGFTLGQADILRRAMSKKKKDIIEEEKKRFVSGAQKLGYDAKEATTVYAYIEKFADYGFNRSHAMAYSLLAYRMAYLKVHYPAAFFASLINSLSLNSTKGQQYLNDMRFKGINLFGPDINNSTHLIAFYKKGLLLGFDQIKGISTLFSERILSKRKNEKFHSFIDFYQRVGQKQSDSMIEKLIRVGAFDSFGVNRASLLKTIPVLKEQDSLFGDLINHLNQDLGVSYQHTAEMPLDQRLNDEIALLGTIVSFHPLASDRRLIHVMGYRSLLSLKDKDRSFEGLVYIQSVEKIKTKKGESMAFLTVSDETKQLTVVVFPKVYYQHISLLKLNKKIVLKGKPSFSKDMALQVIASNFISYDEAKKIAIERERKLVINLDNVEKITYEKLIAIFKKHSGESPLIFVRQPDRRKFYDRRIRKVTISSVLLSEISAIIGEKNLYVASSPLESSEKIIKN